MAKKVTLEVIKRCHKWPVLNVLKVANMPWHTAHTNNPKKKKQITGFISIFFHTVQWTAHISGDI